MISAWKDLSQKLSQQEIANRKTLNSILENNRKSSFQKLLIVDRVGCLGISIMSIIMIYIILFCNTATLILRIEGVAILLSASIFNILGYLKLRSINFEEAVVDIYKKVAYYRQSTIWAYIVCYILVFIFAIHAWFELTFPIVQYGIPIAIIVGMSLDYIIFHWTMRNIDTLRDMTNELKKLE